MCLLAETPVLFWCDIPRPVGAEGGRSLVGYLIDHSITFERQTIIFSVCISFMCEGCRQRHAQTSAPANGI